MTSSPVTEICILQLKAGAAVEDASTEAGATLKKVLASIKAQSGVRKVFWGRKIEDPTKGVLAVVWDSYESHKAYQGSPDYEPLIAAIGAISDSVALHHLVADAAPVLSAPTTEIFTGYVVQPGFADKVKEFAGYIDAEKPAGYFGEVHGEVLEEIAKDGEEEKGKAVQLLIGWESKDAHMAAKSKPGAVSNHIGLLRELRKAVDMYHVQFKEQ